MMRPTMTFFSIPTIVKGLAKKFVIGDGGPGEFCHVLPRGPNCGLATTPSAPCAQQSGRRVNR